jgi:hypothetical protein
VVKLQGDANAATTGRPVPLEVHREPGRSSSSQRGGPDAISKSRRVLNHVLDEHVELEDGQEGVSPIG